MQRCFYVNAGVGKGLLGLAHLFHKIKLWETLNYLKELNRFCLLRLANSEEGLSFRFSPPPLFLGNKKFLLVSHCIALCDSILTDPCLHFLHTSLKTFCNSCLPLHPSKLPNYFPKYTKHRDGNTRSIKQLLLVAINMKNRCNK